MTKAIKTRSGVEYYSSEKTRQLILQEDTTSSTYIEEHSEKSAESVPLSNVPVVVSYKCKKRNPANEVLNIIKGRLSEAFTKGRSLWKELVGRTWASKLRRLSGNMQLLAEKAVNDILFEAEMVGSRNLTTYF